MNNEIAELLRKASCHVDSIFDKELSDEIQRTIAALQALPVGKVDFRQIAREISGTEAGDYVFTPERLDLFVAEMILAIRTPQPATVPEGWTLIPERMPFDLNNMQSLIDLTGDSFTEDEFPECVLWVGETTETDGDAEQKYYGLNLMLADYPEEGSTPIVEFDRPPLTTTPSTDKVPKEEGLAKVIEFLKEGIADATQCEDADQDHQFAKAAHEVIQMLTAAPAAGEGEKCDECGQALTLEGCPNPNCDLWCESTSYTTPPTED